MFLEHLDDLTLRLLCEVIHKYGIDEKGYIVHPFKEHDVEALVEHGILAREDVSNKLIWGEGYPEKYGIEGWKAYKENRL